MAQVTTSRGRLAVDVADCVDELGNGLVASDWISPQPAPATRNLLLGVARDTGDRILVLGNPGDDEVRVTIRIVTPRAVFAPAGLEPVTVAPGSTKPVTLTTLLDEAAAQGAIGLLVEATGPVATSLRQLAGQRPLEVAPAAPLTSSTAVLVPPGKARLLLADPAGVGVATVVALDASGKELSTEDRRADARHRRLDRSAVRHRAGPAHPGADLGRGGAAGHRGDGCRRRPAAQPAGRTGWSPMSGRRFP